MAFTRDQLQTVERKFEIVGGFITPVSDGYGKKGLEKSLHRVNMCKEAVEDSDWIAVDTWESDQAEWKPTLQVLKHIEVTDCVAFVLVADCARKTHVNAFYGNKVRVRVIIACGADLLQSFGKYGGFTLRCLDQADRKSDSWGVGGG